MPFLANEGQVDARVAYYAATFAGTVFVTRQGEVVYALTGLSGGRDSGRRLATRPSGWSLTETLAGGRPQPSAGPVAEAHASFFLGGDPARHRRDLATYTSIGLGEVWPGVTVALHATGRSVEKYFTVQPGVSPGVIRVRVDGAAALRLTPEGALVGETGLGDVTFTAPIAFQEVDEVRVAVPVAYRLDGLEYGFALGDYDPGRPLIIDPILQSTFLGGTADEFNRDPPAAIAIHPTTGDVYVAGYTASTTFPGTAGGAQPIHSAATRDGFVSRFNSTLTTLLQSSFIGGDDDTHASLLAIHPTTGEVYLGGTTFSTTLPNTAGAAQTANGGNGDAFVARFNAALTTLVRSTFFGGANSEGSDGSLDLAIHPTSLEVYLAGRSLSATLPNVAGGAQTANAGGEDAFVARLTSDLSAIFQSTFFGGAGDDIGYAFAIHPTSGEVYVTGESFSATLPNIAGAPQTVNAGNGDAFVARLNSALTSIVQSTFLGGTGNDVASGLAIHPTSGDVYVGGLTSSTPFPGTAGGAQSGFGGGGQDAFIARLNSALTTLSESTFVGGSGVDKIEDLKIHPTTGDVYASGLTNSNPFPGIAGGAQDTFGGGNRDGFIARLNSGLTTLSQSTYFGGGGDDKAFALAIHPSNGIYIVGESSSPTLPGTAGAPQPGNAGLFDGFVARFSADLSAATGVPDLTITKMHAGNFTQGQAGATYTISVTNGGTAATTGTVTVTDIVPAGLTATAISGTGWSCTQPSGPCTRSDTLAAGGSYPAITLTVTVAGNAPAAVTNSAAVSGGGETNTANNTANDPTTVTPQAGVPDLTIAKTHSGTFAQGQTGATYTITVNNGGTGATSGTVTVTDTVPAGLTATAISGSGWTCTPPSGPCTRSDVLAPGASYPVITLTVNVAGNSPANVTNSATVSGGGQTNTANDTANDPTTITPQAGVPDLTIAKTHTGTFTQGQTGATYTITVSNGGPGATSGTVTVADTVPAGLTATAIGGMGWTCTQPSGPCTRSDALAAGASYPAITLTVNVAATAPASVTNSATVSGGGDANTTNNAASDLTTVLAPGTVVPIPTLSSFGWAVLVVLLVFTAVTAMRRRRA